MILILSLSFVGCSDVTQGYIDPDKIDNAHDETLDSYYFEATVLEVYDNSVLVAPLEGSEGLENEDKVDLSLNSVVLDFDLKENQRIGVLYTGCVLESYPIQIKNILKIELLTNLVNEPENTDINYQEKWGITLEAQNVTSSGLTLACHQLNGEDVAELTTGSYFVVQKLENGTYVDMKYLPQEYDVAWTMEAYIISMDATTTWDIDWKWLYGELPIGEYRIGKEITNFKGPGNSETEIIYGYFVIE